MDTGALGNLGVKEAMTGFPPGLIAGHEHAVHGEPGPDPLAGMAPPEVRRPPPAFPSHRSSAPGCIHNSLGIVHTGVPPYLAYLFCLYLYLLGPKDSEHCLGGTGQSMLGVV